MRIKGHSGLAGVPLWEANEESPAQVPILSFRSPGSKSGRGRRGRDRDGIPPLNCSVHARPEIAEVKHGGDHCSCSEVEFTRRRISGGENRSSGLPLSVTIQDEGRLRQFDVDKVLAEDPCRGGDVVGVKQKVRKLLAGSLSMKNGNLHAATDNSHRTAAGGGGEGVVRRYGAEAGWAGVKVGCQLLVEQWQDAQACPIGADLTSSPSLPRLIQKSALTSSIAAIPGRRRDAPPRTTVCRNWIKVSRLRGWYPS